MFYGGRAGSEGEKTQIQLLAPGQAQTLEKQDLRPQQGLSSSSPWRLARPKY